MPRAFVFDAYGTLFDVHAAIGRHRAAAGADADRFSDTWRSKQLEYTWTLTLAGRYADFWTLTQRALDYSFACFPSVDRALRPALLDAYMTLDAFPDARAVLQELKRAGYLTAILSNGSPPMLAAAVDAAKIGGDLDAVLSVDTIGVYKPRPEVYGLVTGHFQPSAARDRLRVLELMGCRRSAGVRLPHGVDQPRRHAGRICRPRAGNDGARSHRPHWTLRGQLRSILMSRRKKTPRRVDGTDHDALRSIKQNRIKEG